MIKLFFSHDANNIMSLR